ncbi:1,4-alpha-glucan branching protein GlgB [Streptococcus cameli]
MNTFSELDLYYMKSGEHTSLFEKMGAHLIKERNKIIGCHFRVYAPNAQIVYLVGSFNDWQRTHPLQEEIDGVYHLFVPEVTAFQEYKYLIITSDGQELYKADPYATYSQIRPETASLTYNPRYKFKDDTWMYHRVHYDFRDKPVSIYEVHLGSWRQKIANKDENGAPVSAFYNYKELAPLLIEHVKENNYTHIELLPIMEHPLDASWGYQVTGYFAPTSRYGKPDDLKHLIDQCHQAGIGVILDWVPIHFCKDSHGLYQFDGSYLYEYNIESDRENHQWGTANFDLSKGLTRSFLLSNIKYWLSQFHFDGIRVDALSYLLYWRGETESKNENSAAIDFIKRVNALVHEEFKGVLMIAEDSSSYPKVTAPLSQGGLGFDMKWDLGWMNDTLSFMARPSIHRPHHSKEITFGMYYNPNEQFLLPLSHDEVVHGKLSIIEKMNGNYEDQFHLARAYYSFFFAHPGKKLLFMGNEWGHIREWHEYTEMDWVLKLYPIHDAFYQMMKTVSTFYREHDAFWKYDYQAHKKGFKWISIAEEANTYAFCRYSDNEEILVVNNFNDQDIFDLQLDLPEHSEYKLVFSSNSVPIDTFHLYSQKDGVKLTIPRLTTYYFQRIH